MGIVEEVVVRVQTKGEPQLEDIQKAMTRLGYNLRLTGRDLMRMGGSLKGLSTYLQGFSRSVFTTSDIIKDAMGDVETAILDVVEVSGFLDNLVGYFEWLADTIEAMPWLGMVLQVLFVAGTLAFLASKLLMVIGFLKLLIGMWLTASKQGWGFKDTLKVIYKYLTGNLELYRKQIELEALLEAKRRYHNKQLKEQEAAMKKTTRAEKKKAAVEKKGRRSLLGLVKMGALAISSLAGMIVFFYALGPLMEALSPIGEALGEAFAWFGEMLEESGIIEWIADFIRNNKELVVAFLLAVAALPLLLAGLKLFGPLLEKITDKLGVLTKFFKGTSETITETGGALDQTGGGFNKTLLLIAAILPSLVLLIHAFIDFLKAVKETGVSLEELFGILEILVVNLGEVVAIVTAASHFLGKFQEIGWANLVVLAELLGSLILLVYAFSDFVRAAGESGFSASELANLISVLSANLSVIIVVIGVVTNFLNSMTSMGWQTIGMVVALGSMVIGLITVFTEFLKVAAETGFQVSEIGTILDKLTIAVVALITSLAIAVVVMAALAPAAVAAAPLVAILLGIGAAAVLVGLGFLLAGLGVKFASEGLALLVSYVPQVMMLIPALFGVSAGMLAVGAAGIFATGGILAFAGALFVLAAALTALIVPLSALRALGGEAAVITFIEKIPALQEGGVVTAPGLAYLHPEEVVVPAGVAPIRKEGYQPKEPPLTVSVDVTGVSSIEEIVSRTVEASIDQISERLERKYRRSEY